MFKNSFMKNLTSHRLYIYDTYMYKIYVYEIYIDIYKYGYLYTGNNYICAYLN